jgi:hypothetical protein
MTATAMTSSTTEGNRIPAGDQQMNINGSDHCHPKQSRRKPSRSGNKNQNRADHFQPSGEVSEPMTQADLFEDSNTHSIRLRLNAHHHAPSNANS